MSNDVLLLIVGGVISLFSVLAGALLQHWLEIRKMRTALQHERQTELEREERIIEKELLEEVGKVSVRLSEEEWKRFISELDPKDAAVFVAARLRARASSAGTMQNLIDSELQAVRYCLNCGAAAKRGSRYCPDCGAKLEAISE